jgi:hypothetical protein
MQFIQGFDKQILEALENENPNICYEELVAAGQWELAKAWPSIARLKSTCTSILIEYISQALSCGSGMALHPVNRTAERSVVVHAGIFSHFT